MALRKALIHCSAMLVVATAVMSAPRAQQPGSAEHELPITLLEGVPEQVVLQWRAPAECAGADAFVAQVAARTPRARWVAPSPGLRVFDVSIRRRSSGLLGELGIQDAAGASSRRTLEGASCDDVVTALALVVALAIDPGADVSASLPATGGRVPGVGEGHGVGATVPVSEAARGPTAGLRIPSSGADIGPAPPLPSLAAAVELDEASSAANWRWAFGVQAFAASGLDAMAVRAGIFVDVARFSDDLLSPSIRLALSVEPPRTVTSDGASGEFYKVAAQPSVCPIGLEPVPSLWLRPCLGVESGVVHGEGHLQPEISATEPWLAAVLTARAEYDVLDRLLLEVQGELGVPIIRTRFSYEPDRTIAEVAAVYGTVGGAAGVRFP